MSMPEPEARSAGAPRRSGPTGPGAVVGGVLAFSGSVVLLASSFVPVGVDRDGDRQFALWDFVAPGVPTVVLALLFVGAVLYHGFYFALRGRGVRRAWSIAGVVLVGVGVPVAGALAGADPSSGGVRPGAGLALLSAAVVAVLVGDIAAVVGNAGSGPVGPPPASVPAPRAPGPAAHEPELAAELRELTSLRDDGRITDVEFQRRRRLLGPP